MKFFHFLSKKRTKKKMIKCAKGAISILLCLLITPFLSIALGIVEYARYQEVLSVTEEIYELTGISSLTDYDRYLHNRFGLLATNQENILGSSTADLLEANSKILGKQITLENAKVEGRFALSDTAVLRRQVVDISELTASTAVLVEDMNIDVLLEKLQGVQQLTTVMNTMDTLATFTDKVTAAVEALEALITSFDNLKSSITTAQTSATELATQMSNLYKKLGDNGIILPSNASSQDIEIAISAFTGEGGYLQDLKNLYQQGNTVVANLNSVKTNLETVYNSIGAFSTAVSEARSAASNIGKSNTADANGSISESAGNALDNVLKEMETLLSDTLNDFKDTAISTAKETVNKIIDSALSSTGLKDVSSRYWEIVNGDYFALPLSDTAKSDLTDLLKTVKTIYDSKSGDALTAFLKEKFVPNINFDVESLKSEIQGAINDAKGALKEKATDSLASLLTKLINTVKKLFDLDLFYDAELNAFVDISTPGTSGYQAFLSAVGSMFSASQDLIEAIGDWDFIKAATAIKDIFVAIKDVIAAIIQIAGDAIRAIGELTGDLLSADMRGLYEKLLISGYMRHNLPSRVSAKHAETEIDTENNTTRLSLNGEGLTGFSYNDIARPYSYYGQSKGVYNAIQSKFQQLAQTMENLKNGSGQDTMFKGAELEYIRAGTNSELANQIIVFFDIYFLRLVLNLPTVFMDGEVNTTAAAANIASWVVYLIYIIAEPFCDTVILVNGAEVPFIKTDCWLTASKIMDFVDTMGSAVLGPELEEALTGYTSSYASSDNGDKGDSSFGLSLDDVIAIDYETNVLILLFIFVESNDQIDRLQNLINLEMAEHYRQQSKEYFMGKSYTVVEISADVTFNPFFDLGLLAGGSSFVPTRKITQTLSY